MLALFHSTSVLLLLLSLLAIMVSPLAPQKGIRGCSLNSALEYQPSLTKALPEYGCTFDQYWSLDVADNKLYVNPQHQLQISPLLNPKHGILLGHVTVLDNDAFIQGLKAITSDKGKTAPLHFNTVLEEITSGSLPGLLDPEINMKDWVQFLKTMLLAKGDGIGGEVTGVEAEKYQEVLKEERFTNV
ncbi:MAG: hypothetical protein NXY57DRAFT_967746 [Lentinula lateritia]|uniref:Uncharacterized protein n=1 Tax=Lentinula lateritia TaxID=40482 RepID=A0ABQ8VTM3_9AGAR|nr:MAG: hypothetical protein NXY57DRAFT_967746 [Lentinula lateritia]KAJ4499731.1 hypothetical protein C8R41DRAFT_915000 [Lentinula lateritia]